MRDGARAVITLSKIDFLLSFVLYCIIVPPFSRADLQTKVRQVQNLSMTLSLFKTGFPARETRSKSQLSVMHLPYFMLSHHASCINTSSTFTPSFTFNAFSASASIFRAKPHPPASPSIWKKNPASRAGPPCSYTTLSYSTSYEIISWSERTSVRYQSCRTQPPWPCRIVGQRCLRLS